MGVGMILIVPPKNVRSVEADLKKAPRKILPHRPLERGESAKPASPTPAPLNL